MRWTLAALVVALSSVNPAVAQLPRSATDVSVEPSGRFEIRSRGRDFIFVGDVGRSLSNLTNSVGTDGVGSFAEVTFEYGARRGSIRVYNEKSTVLFTTTYLSDGPNIDPFPTLTSLPSLPYKLSYVATPFSPYQLNSLDNAPDGPWVFFDASGNGFIISPASNFLVARVGFDGRTLTSHVEPTINSLPARFTHQTILVVGSGPNQLFDTWGSALMALRGKTRPANDADLTLEKLGYWTDNGAVYYYHFEPDLGYAGTLLAIKREFDQRGIALGYLQLDSWFYPKGPNMRWDDRENGIYRYRAAPDLFPEGLPAFQQQVGLPLVTHARWIDRVSPYRDESAFSGNVMTDARYWDDLMSYLQSANVVTYEQDWLGAQAQPVYDLSAPRQFMDNMATAAAHRGMTLQYCMALPRHALQTLEYPNVTTMRVSDDDFDRNRWDDFLYTSRLASALGVWPWADVFMSSERDNLLLANLSAGIVGVGDALHNVNEANLRRVIRADAVLIKPDVPLVPTDESVLAEAQAPGSKSPMLATTYTDHGALRYLYAFGYARDGGSQPITLSPARLGVNQRSYVLDVFGDRGQLVDAGSGLTTQVTTGSYFIAAPVGPSGIAFLGDAGAFVSLGKKRIATVSDEGALTASVVFATGEQAVTLHGYAPSAPVVSAAGGAVDALTYDPVSQRFRFVLMPETTPSTVNVAMSLDVADMP